MRRRRSVGIVRVPVRNVWIRTATTFPRNTRLRTFTGRKNEGRACTHRDPSGERSPVGTTQCPCGCIRRSQSTDAKDMPDVQPPEAVSLSCATIRFQTGCSSGHNGTLATNYLMVFGAARLQARAKWADAQELCRIPIWVNSDNSLKRWLLR